MSRQKWFSAFVLTVFMLGNIGVAEAWDVTADEMRQLPKYCKARYGDRMSKEYKAWAKRIGHDFTYMHHYCNGVVYDLRAERTIGDQNQRRYLSRKAIDNYDYMIKATSAGFALRPDMYLRRGKAKLRMDKTAEGVADLYQAIKLKPKSHSAYLALSDYYQKNEQLEQAAKIVAKGLESNPKSRGLKRRKADLEKLLADNSAPEAKPEVEPKPEATP